MAITVLPSIQEINLSRHMFFIHARTNSYAISAAVRAGAFISVNTLITTPSQIDFLLQDEFGFASVIVRFVNTVSQPYDIPLTGASAPSTLLEFRSAIIEKLNLNARFTNAFNAVDTGIISITSVNFQNSLAYLPTYFGAEFTVIPVAGNSAPSVLRNDFKLVAKLFLYENAFNLKELDKQNIIPEYNPPNIFNIQAFAEIDFTSIAELQHLPEVAPLAMSNTIPFIQENALRRYKITVAEFYDANYHDFKVFDNVYALDAELKHLSFNDVISYCTNIIVKPYKWLSKLKKYKIRNNSKYWLSTVIVEGQQFRVVFNPVRWLNTLGATANGFDASGDALQIQTSLQQNTTGFHKVYRVPCGIDQIIWPNESILQYEVYLIDENDFIISEKFNIEVDQRYLGDELDLVYKNNFGAYMLIRIKGEIVYKLKTKFENLKVAKRNNDNLSVFETKNIDVEKIQEVECKIGAQNTTENLALADFLASKEVYHFIKDKYFPIVLDNSDEDIVSNLQNLQNIEFSFTYSTDKLIY